MNGASASAASTPHLFFVTAAYKKKGASLPRLTFPASYKKSQISSGIARLASRYKVHATVKSVNLSKTSLTLAYGGSYTLKASLSPASAIYESCDWISDKPGVVKVSGGVVTALDVGSATITVKAGSGAKKICKVTVSPPAAPPKGSRTRAHRAAGRQAAPERRRLAGKSVPTVKWTSKDPRSRRCPAACHRRKLAPPPSRRHCPMARPTASPSPCWRGDRQKRAIIDISPVEYVEN